MDELDKNFDGLAERFESRIYGSLKGQIREKVLWRDLNQLLTQFETPSLNILDIGGGLGAFSVELAKRGHKVTYNDVSKDMYEAARQRAEAENISEQIIWSQQSYQDFVAVSDEQSQYDLILCHAVLEWLEKPEKLIPALKKLLNPKGKLSLCFYNPAGLVFRNLMRGNFKMATTTFDMKADIGSLTPRQSSSIEKVKAWLKEEKLRIEAASGIRLFSDYTSDKRGGNAFPEEIMKMELHFSQQEPFIWIARYIHLICSKEN